LAYSTASDVKYVLNIPQTILTEDTELGIWIGTADAHLDAALVKFTSVPLVVIPTQIKWLSAMYAAAHYREARDESRAAGSYLRLITDGYLRTYLSNTYAKGKVVELPADQTVSVSS
jgi:hypothetical protein